MAMHSTDGKLSISRSTLLDQLKQRKKELEFSNEDTMIIINNFGGIKNIMKLCLENKRYYEENIAPRNFTSLGHVTSEKNDPDPDDNDNDDDNDYELTKTETYVPSQTCIEKYDQDINKFDEKLRYIVNGEDNLYFKLLPYNMASKIYHDVLLSYWYPIGFAIIFVAGFTLEFIIENGLIYVGDTFTVEAVIWIILHTLGMFVFGSYLLSVNIRLFFIVGESFTFWFKMYNLFLIIFAEFGLYLTHGWSWQCGEINRGFCFTYDMMSWIIPYTTVFFIDAIYINKNIKIIVLTALASNLMRFSIQAFLYADDSYLDWNPFSKWSNNNNNNNNSNSITDYTIINFKNIYVASVNNLIIFLITPLAVRLGTKIKTKTKTQIGKFCKFLMLSCFKCFKCFKCFRCSKNDINTTSTTSSGDSSINSSDIGCEKSFTIKKRTHFTWININKEKSDLTNLTKTIRIHRGVNHQIQESGDVLNDVVTIKYRDSQMKSSKDTNKNKKGKGKHNNKDWSKSPLHCNKESLEITTC